jgi:hypothetical protein
VLLAVLPKALIQGDWLADGASRPAKLQLAFQSNPGTEKFSLLFNKPMTLFIVRGFLELLSLSFLFS